MEVFISRFFLFFVLPAVIFISSNFALVPLLLVVVSNILIDWLFPARFKISRSILMTAALCQLLLAAEFYKSSAFLSSLSFEKGVHTEFSFDALSVPFVSVVIFGGSEEERMSTANILKDFQYSKLVVEVLTSDSQPKGDLCVFWAAGVSPASENALAFLVREVLVSKSDEKRLVIPKLESGDKSHAVVIDSKIFPYSEDWDQETVAVPILTVVALWKENLPLVSRLLTGDLINGSSDVWACGGSLRVAKYARFTTPHQPASLTDAPRIYGTCQPSVDSDVIIQRFVDVYPPERSRAGRFQFPNNSCLVAFSNLTVGVSACSASDDQLFVTADGGLTIRSVGSCLFPGSGPKCFCLDGGINPIPGSTVKLFHCAKGNRNQNFGISRNRLMWGSYCLHAGLSVTFQICDSEIESETVKFVVS